MDKPQFAQKH